MTRDKITSPSGSLNVSTTCPFAAPSRIRPFVALVLAVSVATMLSGCADTVPRTPTKIDRVVVKKSERKMELIQNGKVLREYRVALGDQPRGHKVQQGDERTPEGNYILDWRNPKSLFYKSIHISYPNELDMRLARYMGTDPGGMIMIHGQPNYIRSAKIRAEYQRRDWTNGCIAVQNNEMDEIWRMVRDGTPITILP